MIIDDENPQLPEGFIKSWLAFSSDSVGMVSTLANGFNRKKKAFEMSNSNRKTVGKIDMHSLWKYKTHDDVFLKKTFKPKGKSHSCFVLMDWSGSMSGQIFPMVKQAIIFAEFCRRSKIPYNIYAFTSNNVLEYDLDYREQREKSDERYYATKMIKKKIPDGCAENCGDYSWGNLVEFMSDKMTEKEFQIAKRRLFALGYSIDCSGGYYSNMSANPKFHLGGTPLNQALLAIRPIIRKHSRTKGIQNPNLIVLSDGASGQLQALYNDEQKFGWLKNRVYVDNTNNKSYKSKNSNGFNSYYEETEILYEMIKSDGVRLIGYFLSRGNKNIDQGVEYIENSNQNCRSEKWWKPHTGSAKDGYAVADNYGGCDSFYIINTRKVFKETGTDLFDEETDVESLTNRQIKSAFKKTNNTSKNRRFLANSLVDDLVSNL